MREKHIYSFLVTLIDLLAWREGRREGGKEERNTWRGVQSTEYLLSYAQSACDRSVYERNRGIGRETRQGRMERKRRNEDFPSQPVLPLSW